MVIGHEWPHGLIEARPEGVPRATVSGVGMSLQDFQLLVCPSCKGSNVGEMKKDAEGESSFHCRDCDQIFKLQ